MSTSETFSPRSIYRSADRAVLGGVCAGLSDYFGLNLRVLRILAVLAFVFAMPMTVIAYLAAVFLIPSRAGTAGDAVPRKETRRACRKERRRARRAERSQEDTRPNEVARRVREQCAALDQRLITLEKYITSPRYQLDREIRDL